MALTRVTSVLLASVVLLIVVAGVLSLVGARRSSTSTEQSDAQPSSEKAGMAEKWEKEIRNSIGMKLVCIPPGKFLMGSPADEQERFADEEQHEVEITRPFYLSAHEVTQQQFREVMGYNPSFFSAFTSFGQGHPGAHYPYSKPAGGKEAAIGHDTDLFPVENVSFVEAVELCKRLSALPAEKQAGRTYRLPTEAEWEFACRGGAPARPFHLGSTLSSRQANFDGKFPYGAAAKTTGLRRTCAVGRYAANGFGLFDMHGNVREWCADWYDKDYYTNNPRLDPQGPSAGSLRVIRGGSWSSDGKSCRSAVRISGAPGLRDPDLGFRVVAVAVPRTR